MAITTRFGHLAISRDEKSTNGRVSIIQALIIACRFQRHIVAAIDGCFNSRKNPAIVTALCPFGSNLLLAIQVCQMNARRMQPENRASIGNQLKTGFVCFYEKVKIS
ncbi:hypothetical protein [Citrobacter portucalensis]|uniref:Uncharacterized protein n=2 Tax=Citrobacter freundii complex TaxID=1344959 RepID=A0A9X4GNR4_9ENTR|nr:hypothetical protein [Citrobacter portucalensis]MDE9620690.1 hypothetical protein [Citrobacter portucalensis]